MNQFKFIPFALMSHLYALSEQIVILEQGFFFWSKEYKELLLSQSSGSIQNTVHELSKIQSQPCFSHNDNHLNCDPRHAWVQQEQLRLSNEACIRQIQPSDIAKSRYSPVIPYLLF
ncbi:hypothetical protein BDEG_28032 [Batrachochytrium dendrobatidis JEL423]|uniref:Uncharacterized protein n=1 Tax=Batrachochytrium dendrobatidis (strain JEL423) TaxID=403673 RepID=A0A177WYU0_BATDL|nr:hypothetical protein BDEG_28032 [Batrachochytrium dendrobatidis JEL423]